MPVPWGKDGGAPAQQPDVLLDGVKNASSTEEAPEVDLSSVITQVSTRDRDVPRKTFRIGARAQSAPQASWKSKMRALLCCFTPSPGTGYRKDVSDGPVPPLPSLRTLRDRGPLIGPKLPGDEHKKTLVLDLDETLVHSSFKPIPSPDCIVPVEIEGRTVDVYVLKRPRLDEFMSHVGQRFEVVVFTASLGKYADPLLDWLDRERVVRWRLFREACLPWEGNYVKDLSFLGRSLAHTIIVDNSPHSYVFQPDNALPISTFIDDMEDQELMRLLPTLAMLEEVSDVRNILGQ